MKETRSADARGEQQGQSPVQFNPYLLTSLSVNAPSLGFPNKTES